MKKTQKNLIVNGIKVATFNIGESKIEVDGEKIDLGQYLLVQAKSNLEYDVAHDLDIKVEEVKKDGK